MSEPAGETLTFEEAFVRLEALVEAMEGGEVPLAELVAKFEEGSKLLQLCQSRLREAELRVEQLRVERDAIRTEPFSPESAG